MLRQRFFSLECRLGLFTFSHPLSQKRPTSYYCMNPPQPHPLPTILRSSSVIIHAQRHHWFPIIHFMLNLFYLPWKILLHPKQTSVTEFYTDQTRERQPYSVHVSSRWWIKELSKYAGNCKHKIGDIINFARNIASGVKVSLHTSKILSFSLTFFPPSTFLGVWTFPKFFDNGLPALPRSGSVHGLNSHLIIPKSGVLKGRWNPPPKRDKLL